MKKLKLLVLLLVALLIIPINVYADHDKDNKVDSEKTEEKGDKKDEDKPLKKEVNVYFFMGEGCGFCEAGLNWFSSIEKKYGDRFDLYTYETWNDEKNAKLMDKVISTRKENVSGVPYIIVGNKSWNGFAEEYTDEILSAIKEEYKVKPEERYDIMNILGNMPEDKVEVKNDYKDDIVVIILLVAVLGGVGYGIYNLRKMN